MQRYSLPWQALRPGRSLAEIAAAFPAGSGPPGSGGRRPRQAFAPRALHALDEFAAVLANSGGVLDAVALELLLHFVLTHLSEPERQALGRHSTFGVLRACFANMPPAPWTRALSRTRASR